MILGMRKRLHLCLQLSTSGLWTASSLSEAIDAGTEGCAAIDEVLRSTLRESIQAKAREDPKEEDDENEEADLDQ